MTKRKEIILKKIWKAKVNTSENRLKTCKYYNMCNKTFFSKIDKKLFILIEIYVKTYCKGNKRTDCIRFKNYVKFGRLPNDKITPDGKILSLKK